MTHSIWPVSLSCVMSRTNPALDRLDRFHETIMARIISCSDADDLERRDRELELLYLLAVSELIVEVVQSLSVDASYPHLALLLSRLHYVSERVHIGLSDIEGPLPYLVTYSPAVLGAAGIERTNLLQAAAMYMGGVGPSPSSETRGSAPDVQ